MYLGQETTLLVMLFTFFALYCWMTLNYYPFLLLQIFKFQVFNFCVDLFFCLRTRQICQRCGKSWNWIFCYFASTAISTENRKVIFLLLWQWIELLFLHELGQLCEFPFWSGSFRQSHIKQSGCLMDSFKQKSPLLWSLPGNLTSRPIDFL